MHKQLQELPWSGISEYQRQDVSMKREYVRLLRNSNFKLNYASTRICILLVFLEVKSPQAHLLPSASQFYVSSFISTFRFFSSEVSYATHFCLHGYCSRRDFAQKAKSRGGTPVACVAGVWKGREREGKGSFVKGSFRCERRRGAREEGGRETSSLLPRAWSRALIPFSFPFERLPRRLVFQ